MISVSNIEVTGFEHAVRAMRNSWDSWDKSDSYPALDGFHIGDKDLELMRKLYKAGEPHRTYARMIHIWMDINAPLYLWKEMDRYTVGKTQISCSTMHTIAKKEFTLDDFSIEHLLDDESYNYEVDIIDYDNNLCNIHSMDMMNMLIQMLNGYREKYLETNDKKYWWQMIQLLPSSYNQKRTIDMSYETMFKIIKYRTGHKLDEWDGFIEVAKDSMPYLRAIVED